MHKSNIQQLGYAIITIITLFASGFAQAQTPVSTAFTYQGQLRMDDRPLNAEADFLFTLRDAETGGSQIGAFQQVDALPVVDGLFTVELDFGVAAFDGDARWLEIWVRSPAGGGDFTTLSPRQPLTPTPYAVRTRGIDVDQNGNVGIGTAEPAGELHIAEESDNPAVIVIDSGASAPHFSAIDFADRGTPFWGMGKDPGNDFYVDAVGVGRHLTIRHGTGFVGIGTTTPIEQLHVEGAVRTDTVRFPDNSRLTSAPRTATAFVDFPPLGPGAGAVGQVVVPGAELGDAGFVNPLDLDLPLGVIITWARAEDSFVRFCVHNVSGTTHDLPRMRWRAQLFK